MDMIDIGSTCEDLWRRFRERKAWAEYRNQPHVKDIRQERALIHKIPIGDISQGIDDILYHAARGRFESIPRTRPKGKRGWVKRVVARWARRARHIAISPRRVEDCWKEYRKFERECELAAASAITVTEEPALNLSIDEAAAELLAPASEQAPEPEPPGPMCYMPPTPPPEFLTHRKPLTAAERQERIRQRREAKFIT
jgi:hypothetical protein